MIFGTERQVRVFPSTRRQSELKRSARGCVGRGAQPATVGFDDRAANRQSHAQTAGLCREEGGEEPVGILWLYTSARILYRHENLVSLLLRSDQEVARAIRDSFHGLHAVHQQIDGNLLQLDPIPDHTNSRRRQLPPQRHAMLDQLTLYEEHNFIDHVIDIQPYLIRLGFPAQRANSQDHFPRTTAIGHHTDDRIVYLVQVGNIAVQEAQAGLSVRRDRRQGLIHLMDDRCCEFSKSRYASDVFELYLRLTQRLLSRIALNLRRDVAADAPIPEEPALGVKKGFAARSHIYARPVRTLLRLVHKAAERLTRLMRRNMRAPLLRLFLDIARKIPALLPHPHLRLYPDSLQVIRYFYEPVVRSRLPKPI